MMCHLADNCMYYTSPISCQGLQARLSDGANLEDLKPTVTSRRCVRRAISRVVAAAQAAKAAAQAAQAASAIAVAAATTANY